MTDFESFAAELQRSPDYRVLRRFVPRQSYADGPVVSQKLGLFVDCETMGLDIETDPIIQLAIQPFLFDNEPEGAERILEVCPGFVWYEDPKRPIPSEIRDLTGITEFNVKDQKIDDRAVEKLFASAVIAIAHKAEFDRPRIERRLPNVVGLPWACSLNEVDWTRQYGAVAKSLGAALAAVGEFTDDAHDALNDCRVGLHVLASATREIECPQAKPDDWDEDDPPCQLCGGSGVILKTAFNDLLRSARVPTIRLWAAFGFDERTSARLKTRRYRWNDGKDGRPKAWFGDVRPDQIEQERAWLLEVIPGVSLSFTRFNAKDRYSERT